LSPASQANRDDVIGGLDAVLEGPRRRCTRGDRRRPAEAARPACVASGAAIAAPGDGQDRLIAGQPQQ